MSSVQQKRLFLSPPYIGSLSRTIQLEWGARPSRSQFSASGRKHSAESRQNRLVRNPIWNWGAHASSPSRRPRASSGVAPELLSHTIPGISGAKKFAGRCFRRDAENHTPASGSKTTARREACAPHWFLPRPFPISDFGINTSSCGSDPGTLQTIGHNSFRP